MDEPTHTTDTPVIAPAFGNGLIVTAFDVEAVPQPLVTAYIIVSVPAVVPVTTPLNTVAVALLALHAPPATASVNVIEEPAHTVDKPVITPALGNAFIVTAFVAVAVPHPLVTAYIIVSMPGVTPVTTPPDTIAVALLALHVPPEAASVNVIDEPIHTPDAPAIVPALGSGLIVTAFDVVVVPQPLVIAYMIVSVPAVTPVTTPVRTVAVALLALQMPPEVASVNVIEEPAHTFDAPVITPASGFVFMVTTFVAEPVQPRFVTVYLMVSAPAATPVTMPVDPTVALAFVLLHTPPVTASANVIDEPVHTLEAPVTEPALGDGLTVTAFVATPVQPEFVTA
jgi:hypothetical protein